MGNVIDIRDPKTAVDAASMVQTALGALGRAEDTRRASIMARVQTIKTADAIQAELYTQMLLLGHDELTETQDKAWQAADDARERARRELPAVIGLTEDELKLLHGVI